MVIFYISGGLANKMFQYAFSLCVKQAGFDVVYDFETFESEFEHDKVQLTDVFSNVKLEKCIDNPFKLIGKQDIKSKIRRRLSTKYIYEKKFRFNDKVMSAITNHCCIDGLWQDPRYFETCNNLVHKSFQFPNLSDERNRNTAEMMKNENSVAVHLRKGDGYGSWDIFNNTCEPDYYDHAINYIKSSVVDPVFYVFSDNPELVEKYLPIKDYILIDWNPKAGKNNYLDMQLMSCAKHNIIANSTYSWWGAWLNDNPEKIVIAPKDWFNPKSKLKGINHIIPENWVKL
jgi:hypothetical protein